VSAGQPLTCAAAVALVEQAALARRGDAAAARASADERTGQAYGRASSTMLNGVSDARRKRLKPPLVATSRRRASPA